MHIFHISQTMLRTPSFYAHVMNGFLVLFAVILMIKYSRVLRPYELLVVVLLFSIGIGVHGISHLGLEAVYQFNPLNAIMQ